MDSSSGATLPECAWLPFLLQTSDSLFPTGAYAHSLGLEESTRLGVVCDQRTLELFLCHQVVPALRECELPYLRFAFGAAARGDLADLCGLDQEISAWKLAAETRDASAALGVRRLKALSTISEAAVLAHFEGAIRKGDASGHHLVVCGLQAAVGTVPLPAVLGAYFYQSCAAVCSAALKLIRIGQEACQRSLRAALSSAPAAIAASLLVERPSAGSFHPLLEIASMRHQQAGERLFIS